MLTVVRAFYIQRVAYGLVWLKVLTKGPNVQNLSKD